MHAIGMIDTGSIRPPNSFESAGPNPHSPGRFAPQNGHVGADTEMSFPH
jgi:hypothetical protein